MPRGVVDTWRSTRYCSASPDMRRGVLGNEEYDGIALLSLLVSGVGIRAALAALIVIPVMLPINFFGSRIAGRD
jgi:hypothetical protein